MKVLRRPNKTFRRKTDASQSIPLKVFDPRTGDLPFAVESIHATDWTHPQRFNYFTVLWIQEGTGVFHVDLKSFPFSERTLLFANPYQTLFIEPERALRGSCLQFHANFFCIETYHHEVGCNGILFNDIYGPPVIRFEAERATEVQRHIDQISDELASAGLAHSELLLSYLKVFLIKATRKKLEQQKRSYDLTSSEPPSVLTRLQELIEEHYRSKHRPAEYAALLSITPKALGKLVKAHFGETLGEVIRERIMKHAKWQLLHTRKAVKEVAAEVGFLDEFYFCRVFKRATGLTPTAYREFETAIRGGRNLSM